MLRTECDPVTRFDDALGRLVDDLLENVLLPGRAGLAAPQIGVSLAAFSYNIDGQHGYLINPVVAEMTGEYDGPEGCLSIPGVTAPALGGGATVVPGSTARRPRHGRHGRALPGPRAQTDHLRGGCHRPAHRRAPQGRARPAPPGRGRGRSARQEDELPVVRREARSSCARAA